MAIYREMFLNEPSSLGDESIEDIEESIEISKN